MIKNICVGNDKKYNSRIFYCTDNKSSIYSADYKIYPSIPSDSVCVLPYDGQFQFQFLLYHSDYDEKYLRPTQYSIVDTVYHALNIDIDACILFKIPRNETNQVIIQHNNGNINQIYTRYLSTVNPNEPDVFNNISQQFPWIKHGCQCTMYSKLGKKHQQEILQHEGLQ